MPRYEVHITELSLTYDAHPDPSEPTPEVRDVITTVEEANEQAAEARAWLVWDAKYGPGQRPEHNRIEIRPL